jgi:hypothetical protein
MERILAEITGRDPVGYWGMLGHGRVSGIHGNVDRSVASFDDDDLLIRWCD